MQIPVDQIVNSEPNNFQGLTKTTFQTSAAPGQTVYMFHQPQNAPQVGTVLEGSITPDRRGMNKFTKAKDPNYGGGSSSQSSGGGSGAREYKADPEKQASIERQSYFKTLAELYASTKDASTSDFKTAVQSVLDQTRYVLKELDPKRTTSNGEVLPTDEEVSDFASQVSEVMPGSKVVDDGGML